MDEVSKQIHLYQRAGFGFAPKQLFTKTSIAASIATLLAPKENFKLISFTENWASLPKEQREEQRKMARKESQKLGGYWLKQMIATDDVLLEKMTLFWHGHFACHINARPDFGVSLNNIMRDHALGNFRVLTKKVAREPAMLDFLNNTQNKKSSPNENFSRELMELFTIGRDNYTETDIKEAARAFSGWAHTPDGDFVVRKKHHDYDRKQFMGKTDNLNGDDIIDILCKDKRTSEFIAGKLYKFFVADMPDKEAISELANVLYKHDYEIKPTLNHLFSAKWFYDSAGTKIKSPTELLVGLSRAYGIKYNDDQSLIFLQRSLGQHLFRPPNVAGWPAGQKWIDSSTLAFRMRLPSILLNKGVIEWNLKDEPDKMIDLKTQYRNRAKEKSKKWLQISTDWNFVEDNWKNISQEFFVNIQLPPIRSSMANDLIEKSRTDLKSLATTVLSLPEYQLC